MERKETIAKGKVAQSENPVHGHTRFRNNNDDEEEEEEEEKGEEDKEEKEAGVSSVVIR